MSFIHSFCLSLGCRCLLLIGLGAISVSSLPAREGESDWGPLYSAHYDNAGKLKKRGAGPFYSAHEADGEQFWGIHPFYSRSFTESNDRDLQNLLWPLGSIKEQFQQRSWWFATALGWNFDVNDPESRHRLWLLPLWFSGKDAQGENYAALFPLGGHLHEFLGRDKIEWWLFPLYFETDINDVHSETWMWPIYSNTKGKNVERFRVFPFYGRSSLREDWRKWFVMWPFYSAGEYTYKGSQGGGWMLFPIAGHMKLSDQETWYVIPPLFRYMKNGEQTKQYLPWPIIQKSDGPTKKFYIWPLYGWKKTEDISTEFALYPIFIRQDIERPTERIERRVVAPIWHWEKRLGKDEAGKVVKTNSTYQKLWPFYSFSEKAGPGGTTSHFRCLELSPLRNVGGLERNWIRLWTLAEHHKEPGFTETEVLWGMYRRVLRGTEYRNTSIFPLVEWGKDVDRQRDGWQIGKGLLGYGKDEGKKRLKLLWFLDIPVGK